MTAGWLIAVLMAVPLLAHGQEMPGGLLERPAGSELPRTATGSITTPALNYSGDPEAVRAERGVINPLTTPTFPLEEPLNPDAYICGRGDTFELNFWGRQNFKLQVVVDLEGRTFISKVGYVNVVGKTLTQARNIIKQAVLRYYPGLSFDITLAAPRTFLVHVVEYVRQPGIYAATPIDRLTSVMARAGGITGSQRRIEIQRRDGTRLTADLLLYHLTGDTKHNPFVMDGDVIRVPHTDVVVTISGPVRRPGSYELIHGKDLAELLGLADGFTTSATWQLPIVVVRRDGNDRAARLKIPYRASATPSTPTFPLQNEDLVSVPGSGELQPAVFIVGAVAGGSPTDEATSIKRMTYQEGDTVRSLIERAGGVGPGADLKASYIIRPGSSDGLIPLDLEALIIRRDFTADRSVQIQDTIMIPYKRHSIAVEGAIMRPGVYQFNPQFTLLDYVATAGGPSKMAQSQKNFSVVTPSGKIRRIGENPQLSPGDTIVVPERTFSHSEIVQIVLSVASVVISSVALGIAATR